VDAPIRRATRLLTAETFQSTLDLIYETLVFKEEFAAWNLIHISTIFLKDAPEGVLNEPSFKLLKFL
jgi:hypothetical protein